MKLQTQETPITDPFEAGRILDKAAEDLVDMLDRRFAEAKRNLPDDRPVAKAAAKLLDGTLDVAAEVKYMTGVDVDLSQAKTHKPILLVASKFGTWASELTLVAGVLLKAGYQVVLASEDGSPPHMLAPSMTPGTADGAWRFSVVSEEERDLALRFLQPGTAENAIFRKEIFNIGNLAKPPQVGDYLKDETLLDDYRTALKQSMRIAEDYDAIVVAGGSGAIPGLMFDRGLHALILAFHVLKKPIMGECNGGLSILQTLEAGTTTPILAERAVTTHSMLDEYQEGWGWTLAFDTDTDDFWKGDSFDISAYAAAETWNQPGERGNPLIDSEGYFREAAGSKGSFFSPAGSAYSVVADGHFITCRTTPDGYPGVLCLIATMDGKTPIEGPLFIDSDKPARKTP